VRLPESSGTYDSVGVFFFFFFFLSFPLALSRKEHHALMQVGPGLTEAVGQQSVSVGGNIQGLLALA